MRHLLPVAPLRIAPLLIALSLAACGGDAIDDEDNPGFVPPTAVKRAEFAALLDPRFKRMDVNTDGVIEVSEIRNRKTGRTAALDADRDGKITRTEFVDGSLARFDREDANHDGTLTGEERRAATGK